MNFIVGVDFDNTIINYDKLIYDIALERKLITKNLNKGKKEIKDSIRKIKNGDIEWQKIQAEIYGPRINEAELIEGVKEFFCLCKNNKVPFYIISHKTEYSNLYKEGVNFRTAAIEWMKNNRFFNDYYLGMLVSNVYFESTRSEKIQRIRSLECTHFIDDMEEIFIDKEFPENVEKLLYDHNRDESNLDDMVIFKSWNEIINYFYGN